MRYAVCRRHAPWSSMGSWLKSDVRNGFYTSFYVYDGSGAFVYHVPDYTQCKCASRCRRECGLRAVHPHLDAGVCACISLHLVSRCSQVCSIGISNVGEMLALFASSTHRQAQLVARTSPNEQTASRFAQKGIKMTLYW